jgi:hypothetical protein
MQQVVLQHARTADECCHVGVLLLLQEWDIAQETDFTFGEYYIVFSG